MGTIIENNGKIEKEISERIGKVGTLYNYLRNPFFGKKEIPKEIKTQVYQKVIRPSLTYGSESWVLTKRNKSRIKAAEMRFLRKIQGITREDRIRNSVIVEELKIKPIEKIIEERQLSWLGHLLRMKEERITKQVYEARTQGRNKVGRPRIRWEEQVRQVAENQGISWKEVRTMSQDRKLWKRKIKDS